MSNLTKRDLTLRISDETNLAQAKVARVIELTFEHLIESLSRGQTVELRNFGVFKVVIRKAHVGRNPNKPEFVVPIPPRFVVKFRSGKDLRAKVLLLSKGLYQTESRNDSKLAVDGVSVERPLQQ